MLTISGYSSGFSEQLAVFDRACTDDKVLGIRIKHVRGPVDLDPVLLGGRG